MTNNIPNPLFLDETGKRIADAVEQIASGADPLFHADSEDNTKPMFGEAQLAKLTDIPVSAVGSNLMFGEAQMAKLTDIPVTVVGNKLMFGDKEIAFVQD